MEPKNILLSKTFWFNVVTTAVTFSGYLPPEYALPIATVGNILLRFLTVQPVKLL